MHSQRYAQKYRKALREHQLSDSNCPCEAGAAFQTWKQRAAISTFSSHRSCHGERTVHLNGTNEGFKGSSVHPCTLEGRARGYVCSAASWKVLSKVELILDHSFRLFNPTEAEPLFFFIPVLSTRVKPAGSMTLPPQHAKARTWLELLSNS